jgi:hypothetical protein
MVDDTDELEAILNNLHSALRKTVSDGTFIYSQYATQLLQITTQYSNTVMVKRRAKPLVWGSDRHSLRAISEGALSFAKNSEWQRALEQSHIAMSSLPGEPGGIPITPPKLPW